MPTFNSDIRQIPDHQEVFLSPTTLTSIVFEINTYVNPGATDPNSPSGPTTTVSTSTQPDGSVMTTSTTTSMTSTTVVSSNGGSNTGSGRSQAELDAEAAKFHFKDVIAPPDTLASTLPDPQPVKMVDMSLAQYPAYMLAGNIDSVEVSRNSSQPQNHPSTAPPGFPTTRSSHSPTRNQQLSSIIHQLQILIRLPSHGTDICVRINVPLKEFAEAGQRFGSSDSGAAEAMIAEELGRARDLMARVVGTLRVREWGLFGA